MKTTIKLFLMALAVALSPLLSRAQNLYMAAGDVYVIATNGTVSTFVSGVVNSTALAFDGAGNLYVADVSGGNNGCVDKFTPGGTHTLFADGLNAPDCMAFDSLGDLFVSSTTGSFGIYKITPDGARHAWAGASEPWGMACDSAGNLYVADYFGTSIIKVTTNGMHSFFTTGLSGPSGLACDSADNLFVANSDGSIYKFTTNGVSSTFASGLNNPRALAFDNAGNLYVGEQGGSGNIYKYTPDGTRTLYASEVYPWALAFPPVSAPPRLNIASAGQQATLFWPASARALWKSPPICQRPTGWRSPMARPSPASP